MGLLHPFAPKGNERFSKHWFAGKDILPFKLRAVKATLILGTTLWASHAAICQRAWSKNKCTPVLCLRILLVEQHIHQVNVQNQHEETISVPESKRNSARRCERCIRYAQGTVRSQGIPYLEYLAIDMHISNQHGHFQHNLAVPGCSRCVAKVSDYPPKVVYHTKEANVFCRGLYILYFQVWFASKKYIQYIDTYKITCDYTMYTYATKYIFIYIL